MKMLSSFVVGEMAIHYLQDESGRTGLRLVPAVMESKIVEKRKSLAGLAYIDAMPDAGNPPALVLDPLVQLKLVGDAYPGPFAQGHTLRNSPSVNRFRYDRQEIIYDGDKTSVITFLSAGEGGQVLEHVLSWHAGDDAVAIETVYRNHGMAAVRLEMLSSFSFGNITPFHETDAPGRLLVHRFRSVWSAEGRLETRSLEELHLERSWSGAGMFSERFGQIGSMPVRRWFPFAAVEDTEAKVVWAAQVAWAGSWQIEIYRQHDDVSLSGGLADREFGHWMKEVAPGESFRTPPSYLTCVHGCLDNACDNLTDLQQRAANTHPETEQDLPIVFNEWCTTWGDPSHDKVVAIANKLKNSGIRYLVIDAGWYKDNGTWYHSHGDWNPNHNLFPSGLEATAAAIRERGILPGLWFEMEVCGKDSVAFSLENHLLKRDNTPVTVNGRRFWDLNDPWVENYLAEKVIGLLDRCGFGYLKVDYNDTIGIGADHSDSQGEGLRRQIEGIYRLFKRIRSSLPHLVIENCASGGHRLEPSMLALTAMSSFSDAHELLEIPLIAAGLHRLVLPRQSQIWAVLHTRDSDERLIYSLAATFLGRMCLSGEIAELSPLQWELVQSAVALYSKAAPILKYGTSRIFSSRGESWRHPTGWQALRRVSHDGQTMLIVGHSFKNASGTATIPVPAGNWKLDAALTTIGWEWRLQNGYLISPVTKDFGAGVWIYKTGFSL